MSHIEPLSVEDRTRAFNVGKYDSAVIERMIIVANHSIDAILSYMHQSGQVSITDWRNLGWRVQFHWSDAHPTSAGYIFEGHSLTFSDSVKDAFARAILHHRWAEMH